MEAERAAGGSSSRRAPTSLGTRRIAAGTGRVPAAVVSCLLLEESAEEEAEAVSAASSTEEELASTTTSNVLVVGGRAGGSVLQLLLPSRASDHHGSCLYEKGSALPPRPVRSTISSELSSRSALLVSGVFPKTRLISLSSMIWSPM